MRKQMKLMMAAASIAFTMVIAAGLIAATDKPSFTTVEVPRVDTLAPKVDVTSSPNPVEETVVPTFAYDADSNHVKLKAEVVRLENELGASQEELAAAKAKLAEWKEYRVNMESFLHRNGFKVQGEDQPSETESHTQVASVSARDLVQNSVCTDCQKSAGGSSRRRGR